MHFSRLASIAATRHDSNGKSFFPSRNRRTFVCTNVRVDTMRRVDNASLAGGSWTGVAGISGGRCSPPGRGWLGLIGTRAARLKVFHGLVHQRWRYRLVMCSKSSTGIYTAGERERKID